MFGTYMTATVVIHIFLSVNATGHGLLFPRNVQALRTGLNGEIERILKFSYDALCDEDKALFLHIACFLNRENIETLEDSIGETFWDVAQRIHVLSEKSFISIILGFYNLVDKLFVKNLSESLGKANFWLMLEIFLKYSPTIIQSVVGIDLNLFQNKDSVLTSRSDLYSSKTSITKSDLFSNDLFAFKVKSKLEKLWEGNQELCIIHCLSMVEFPSSIGNATNQKELGFTHCSSLVKLPSSIGNATRNKKLSLYGCTSLMYERFLHGCINISSTPAKTQRMQETKYLLESSGSSKAEKGMLMILMILKKVNGKGLVLTQVTFSRTLTSH
ncbi:unnamed protein product [Thlaspi arvense]|uniref:Disease resistance protein Roq1-like winged-helix domain-containing protein n=1 Tax=Thlaspi arvense TaxID=13288 RepID=A0AAU9T5U4_THLAR|nr:unnamed protein product [Thlaspi arvense]